MIPTPLPALSWLALNAVLICEPDCSTSAILWSMHLKKEFFNLSIHCLFPFTPPYTSHYKIEMSAKSECKLPHLLRYLFLYMLTYDILKRDHLWCNYNYKITWLSATRMIALMFTLKNNVQMIFFLLKDLPLSILFWNNHSSENTYPYYRYISNLETKETRNQCCIGWSPLWFWPKFIPLFSNP